MNNNLNEYSMRQASIYELRNIAREMGIISPTTLKKDDLVSKILKILSGEEKPQMPKNRQGRPPKKKLGTDDGISICKVSFNEVENMDYGIDQAKDTGKFLNSPQTFSEFDYENDSNFRFEEKYGYVQKVPNGNYFVFDANNISDPDNAIFIAKNFILQYNLKSGDFVKCICKRNLINNNKFLVEIKEVNNFEKEFENKDFDDIVILSERPSQVLFETSNNNKFKSFESCKKGSRNIVDVKDFYDVEEILKFLSKNASDNLTVLNVCFDVLPEQRRLFFNADNIENFYTNLCQTEKQNNFALKLAIERTKRLVQCGKSVVLFVNDIEKMIKYKNFAEGNQIFDLKSKSLDNCLEVLSLSRNCEKGQSITVICAFRDRQNDFCKLVKQQLEELNCNFLSLS